MSTSSAHFPITPVIETVRIHELGVIQTKSFTEMERCEAALTLATVYMETYAFSRLGAGSFRREHNPETLSLNDPRLSTYLMALIWKNQARKQFSTHWGDVHTAIRADVGLPNTPHPRDAKSFTPKTAAAAPLETKVAARSEPADFKKNQDLFDTISNKLTLLNRREEFKKSAGWEAKYAEKSADIWYQEAKRLIRHFDIASSEVADPKNNPECIKSVVVIKNHFLFAAELSHPLALFELYLFLSRASLDKEEALNFLNLTAIRGNIFASYQLICFYGKGEVVNLDLRDAWLNHFVQQISLAGELPFHPEQALEAWNFLKRLIPSECADFLLERAAQGTLEAKITLINNWQEKDILKDKLVTARALLLSESEEGRSKEIAHAPKRSNGLDTWDACFSFVEQLEQQQAKSLSEEHKISEQIFFSKLDYMQKSLPEHTKYYEFLKIRLKSWFQHARAGVIAVNKTKDVRTAERAKTAASWILSHIPIVGGVASVPLDAKIAHDNQRIWIGVVHFIESLRSLMAFMTDDRIAEVIALELATRFVPRVDAKKIGIKAQLIVLTGECIRNPAEEDAANVLEKVLEGFYDHKATPASSLSASSEIKRQASAGVAARGATSTATVSVSEVESEIIKFLTAAKILKTGVSPCFSQELLQRFHTQAIQYVATKKAAEGSAIRIKQLEEENHELKADIARLKTEAVSMETKVETVHKVQETSTHTLLEMQKRIESQHAQILDLQEQQLAAQGQAVERERQLLDRFSTMMNSMESRIRDIENKAIAAEARAIAAEGRAATAEVKAATALTVSADAQRQVENTLVPEAKEKDHPSRADQVIHLLSTYSHFRPMINDLMSAAKAGDGVPRADLEAALGVATATLTTAATRSINNS